MGCLQDMKIHILVFKFSKICQDLSPRSSRSLTPTYIHSIPSIRMAAAGTGRQLRYWIGVASRDHVHRGKTGGFAQVCHGKSGPLKQMKEGDYIVYYSPTIEFGQKGKSFDCKSFTTIGRIASGAPYQVEMFPGFVPYRINVNYYVDARAASILPLIPLLSFIPDKKSWGFPFRRGSFEIPQHDFELIAARMLSTEDLKAVTTSSTSSAGFSSEVDVNYNHLKVVTATVVNANAITKETKKRKPASGGGSIPKAHEKRRKPTTTH
jgi:hypothetical protein